MRKLFIFLFLSFPSLALSHLNETAPGAPGMMGVWSRPDKEAFLATRNQNLWATVADGILTETFFPTIDRAQTKDTQILILMDKVLLEERRDFRHVVKRYPQSLAFHVSSINDAYQIRIEKDIVLDPRQTSLLISYTVTFSEETSAKIYLLHNPAADNTAGGDTAVVTVRPKLPGEIVAFQSDRRGDEPPALARRGFQHLLLDRPAQEGSAGFEGFNDPWTQLHSQRALVAQFGSAQFGNVAAALGFPIEGAAVHFRFVLSFAEESPNTLDVLKEKSTLTLKSSPDQLIETQREEWIRDLAALNPVGQQLEGHYLMIRGLEDKIHPGAIVAGPGLPAIPDALESKETNYEQARLRAGDANGGYHRVWPRDAVQMALGLLAAGDLNAPLRVLRMLEKIQAPSGIFPQNVWVDGSVSWTGFQLDQTAFPIILASRLVELGVADYDEFRVMVLNAADALVNRGPFTDQDRWEENRGLSPNTIAVACQALDEAAFLEKTIEPMRSQVYASTCQKWKDSLIKWTFVDSGPLGRNYFERMEIASDSSHSAPFHVQNHPADGDTFPENELIDGGFIQWIISGLFPPNESHFSSSLNVYDRVARAPAFNGLGYLRYNHDGFGPDHRGRAWPLLSGERALAALTRKEDPAEHLRVLASSVSPAGIICEQTSVSNCPLGWAHAEMLLVRRSLDDKKSFYIPGRLAHYYE